MGIVHHTNYLRFMEEARVSWAHAKGLIDYQKPESAAHFAVLETQVKHLGPARFGDQLHIQVQARMAGRVRVQFQYRIINSANSQIVASGSTLHAALDSRLLPMRIPQPMKTVLEKEIWTETWLSNL